MRSVLNNLTAKLTRLALFIVDRWVLPWYENVHLFSEIEFDMSDEDDYDDDEVLSVSIVESIGSILYKSLQGMEWLHRALEETEPGRVFLVVGMRPISADDGTLSYQVAVQDKHDSSLRENASLSDFLILFQPTRPLEMRQYDC